VACAWLAGCAGTRPEPATVPAAHTGWGDEYEGLLSDTDLADADFHATRTAFAADALASDDGRVVRASGATGPVAARYRWSQSTGTGAVEFASRRLGVVVGAVRASLGEGALLADARDAASVEPRGSRSLDGLRITPSSSTWGSSPGAGVRVSAARVRLAAGVWRERDSPGDSRAFVSAGFLRRRMAVFAALGQSGAGARGFSIAAAHAGNAAFLSGEAALASDGMRGAVRVVAGDDGAWRALVAAGAPSTADDPAPASAAARWGGAVERRFNAGGVASRAMLSTRVRRDGPDVQRRQRAEWYASFGAGGGRVETGVRATREGGAAAADLLEPAAPPFTRDELRLRCVFRAAEALGEALYVEQSYRADVIVTGAGPAGRVVAWTGRVRWRGVDTRVQASAFDLSPGQLAYTGRAVLPGAATFTTLSRSGMDLSASVRLRLPWGAGIGVQGVLTPAGGARVALQAGVAL
jgi:hypothetical protein